ncbi:hypothetical protein CRUP_025954 [Coryphaenoides rupestris]|nr:hypothetical protein CRUP_025954 [Coryphaenoides rupestris]
MASSSRRQVVAMFRLLIKECRRFPSYNFRKYALRRVRDGFRENQHVDNPKKLDELLTGATESLALIKRQVMVGKMYDTHTKTIVELLEDR